MNKYNEIEIQTAKNLLEKGFKWITRGIYGAILAYKIKPDQEKYGYGNVICSDRVPIFESIRCGDEPVSLESIVYPQILDDDDLINRQEAIDALAENMPSTYSPDGSHPADEGIFMAQEVYADCIQMLKELPSAQPDENKYEYHYDHTDCIWYRPEARNRCPVTCAQYRDGWNDAMDYIFRDGKGYMPYRRGKQYE